MHIKVKYAERFDFGRCARPRLDKKIFVAVLDYSDAAIIAILQDQRVPVTRQLTE